MRLQLHLEQALELVRIEAAADHQSQAVPDELHQMVIGLDLGIVLEQRAAVFGVEAGLDRHESVLADFHQHVVQQLQQLDVVLALVARTLDDGERSGERGFDDLGGIGGEKGSQRRADDDEDFGGMPEREDVAALEDEAPDDAQNDNYGTDYLNHSRRLAVYGCTVRRAGSPCIGSLAPHL